MPDKEQKVEFIESYIKIGNGDYKWNDNHGELVRCGDCKYRTATSLCGNLDGKCSFIAIQDDWFCADGKRWE